MTLMPAIAVGKACALFGLGAVCVREAVAGRAASRESSSLGESARDSRDPTATERAFSVADAGWSLRHLYPNPEPARLGRRYSCWGMISAELVNSIEQRRCDVREGIVPGGR